jgi:hypothetical protein
MYHDFIMTGAHGQRHSCETSSATRSSKKLLIEPGVSMSLKRPVSMRASLFVAGLILTVPALVCGVRANGQKQAAVDSTSAAKPVAAAAHKGIVVHGQWKIVVKNADGTTASTTKFENSLVDSGFTLEHLMQGSIVTSTWGIGVSPDTGGVSPCGTSVCVLLPSTTSVAGTYLCGNINYQQTATCYGGLAYLITGGTFQLAGQFVASQAGTITSVSTINGFCVSDTTNFTAPSTISPASCAAGDANAGAASFTSATATSTPAFSPVTINSGQTVQITVAVSLS